MNRSSKGSKYEQLRPVAAGVGDRVPGDATDVGSQPEATNGTANAVQALAFDVASHPRSKPTIFTNFSTRRCSGRVTPSRMERRRRTFSKASSPNWALRWVAEGWCDTLGGDPMLVRVNLRPFVANGFSNDALVEAFVATATRVRADPQQMGVALDLVVQWLQSDGRQELGRDLHELARTMPSKAIPGPPQRRLPAGVPASLPCDRGLDRGGRRVVRFILILSEVLSPTTVRPRRHVRR